MATVPSSHDFVSGVATSSEANAYIRDPIAYMLARPIAKLRQTVAQSLTSGAFTPITFTTEDVDSAGAHDTVTNTSRYTAVYAGWYLVSYTVGFAVSATGRRIAYLTVNGTAVGGTGVALGAFATFATVITASSMVFLNVGDYVEVNGYQDSGGPLNTSVAQAYEMSSMTVIWVSNA